MTTETSKNTRPVNTYHNPSFIVSLKFGETDLMSYGKIKDAAFSVLCRDRGSAMFLNGLEVLTTAIAAPNSKNGSDAMVMDYKVGETVISASLTRSELYTMKAGADAVNEAKIALDKLTAEYTKKHAPIVLPELPESGKGSRNVTSKIAGLSL